MIYLISLRNCGRKVCDSVKKTNDMFFYVMVSYIVTMVRQSVQTDFFPYQNVMISFSNNNNFKFIFYNKVKYFNIKTTLNSNKIHTELQHQQKLIHIVFVSQKSIGNIIIRI